MPDNNKIFRRLRKRFPVFTYEDYFWEEKDNTLHFGFHFKLDDRYNFYPRYSIPLKNWKVDHVPPGLVKNLVFHIGLTECISYWKTACPPTIHIKPCRLSQTQIQWWKRLYFMGLGEFFYVNGITIEQEELVTFTFDPMSRSNREYNLEGTDDLVIPIGGGKDSLTALGILSDTSYKKVAFAINPGRATIESVKMAGLEDQFLVVNRSLDSTLLKLNEKGFLNGHTPFSALVAFISCLGAAITGHRQIALSNESSANEPTIPGTQINHQYSKSFDFESNFMDYVANHICNDLKYFSLLRPLNELQIAAIFSQNSDFLKVFRSCNVGSKTNTWCCNCPKCLFTAIMLAPFVSDKTLKSVFGENLLEKESLIPLLNQLCGIASEKPFECIGTVDEVNSALSWLTNVKYKKKLPALLLHYQSYTSAIRFRTLEDQLRQWNSYHLLPTTLEDLVKKSLQKTTGL